MLTNFHTHTTYCDGKESAETMVKGAIERGFAVLGFSSHAHTNYEDTNMDERTTPLYKAEVLALKAQYRNEIEIRLGAEQDINGDFPTDDYDYIIGSTHAVLTKDGYKFVDSRIVLDTVDEYFGGDWYKLCAEYFATHANIARITHCNIVGHFDLVRRYNGRNEKFDTSDRRYTHAATDAVNEILKDCRLFELNTGGIYKGGVPEQYPEAWLIKEIHARGGEIILSSDSHDVPSLGYKFKEMTELLTSLGITPVTDYK